MATNLITQVDKETAQKPSNLELAKKKVATLRTENLSNRGSAQSPRTLVNPKLPSPKVQVPVSSLDPPKLDATLSNQTLAPVNTPTPKKKSKFNIFSCFCFDKKDATVPMTKVKNHKTGSEKPALLKSQLPSDIGKKCLVLDLDETLVHSSFKPVAKADFVIPVEIDKTVHNVYVLKRPGVDTFLKTLGNQYEIVVFTASLAKYADPVLDVLDSNRVVRHRLFRESCIHHKGAYVKDLSLLGRDLSKTIIIDNSPSCYMFHPGNAIPITSWFDDVFDTELVDLIPFLEDLKHVDNVVSVLDNSLD